MEDLTLITAITQQIAGFLEQALAEARLEQELQFWADILQGLKELYENDTLEVPKSPQAIKTPIDNKGHPSTQKLTTTALSAPKLRPHPTPLGADVAKDSPRLTGHIHSRGQSAEPAAKRVKRHQSTFATRAAEYQEQDGIHQALLAQASWWESVVSQACKELGSQTAGGQTGAVDDQKQPGGQTQQSHRLDQAGAASGWSAYTQATIENQVLYFCRVFGKPGRQRLRDILRSIRQHQSEGKLIGDQAETQHGLEQGSRLLREWITSIQQQDQARKVELGVAFQKYLLSAQQYEKWMALLQAAEDPRSETSAKMHALGLTTSQGRDVRTNVKAYFLNVTRGFDIREAAAKVVDIKNPELTKARNSLQNTIAIGRTYYVLREVFGPGIFLLLPEQAPGYFRNNWTKANFKIIIDTVAAVIPDATLYCARLFELILQPLQDSRVIPPLKIEVVKGRSGQGLLELLQPQEETTASVGIPDLAVEAPPPIEAAASTGEEGLSTAERTGAEAIIANSSETDGTENEE